ncbi:MAG: hypothetical protein WKF90_08280 [Pyrinomonadaceae bacterium]
MSVKTHGFLFGGTNGGGEISEASVLFVLVGGVKYKNARLI